MNPRRPHMVLVLALAALSAGCHGEDKPVATPPPAPSAPALPTPPAPVSRAQLKGLHGSVNVKRTTGDDWIPAQEDMPLYENDKVRTVAGAGVQIVFPQGSVVNVGEDALISIADKERTDLTVLRGRVDAELKDSTRQSLTLTTPAATVRAGRAIVFQ